MASVREAVATPCGAFSELPETADFGRRTRHSEQVLPWLQQQLACRPIT